MQYTYELEHDGQTYDVTLQEPDWQTKIELYAMMPSQIRNIGENIHDFDVNMGIVHYMREVTQEVAVIDMNLYDELGMDTAFRLFGAAVHVMVGKEPPSLESTDDDFRVETGDSLFETDDDGFVDLEDWE